MKKKFSKDIVNNISFWSKETAEIKFDNYFDNWKQVESVNLLDMYKICNSNEFIWFLLENCELDNHLCDELFNYCWGLCCKKIESNISLHPEILTKCNELDTTSDEFKHFDNSLLKYERILSWELSYPEQDYIRGFIFGTIGKIYGSKYIKTSISYTVSAISQQSEELINYTKFITSLLF